MWICLYLYLRLTKITIQKICHQMYCASLYLHIKFSKYRTSLSEIFGWPYFTPSCNALSYCDNYFHYYLTNKNQHSPKKINHCKNCLFKLNATSLIPHGHGNNLHLCIFSFVNLWLLTHTKQKIAPALF